MRQKLMTSGARVKEGRREVVLPFVNLPKHITSNLRNPNTTSTDAQTPHIVPKFNLTYPKLAVILLGTKIPGLCKWDKN